MLGIAVGVSVQIFIGILIDSLQQSLLTQTVGSSPHVSIVSTSDGSSIQNWQPLVSQVQQASAVTKVEAIAEKNVFLTAGEFSQPVLLRGRDTSLEGFYDFSGKIIEGSSLLSPNEILIGEDLSKKINLSIGDSVTLSYPQGQPMQAKIVGIFDFKVAAINSLWVITDLKTAQSFFGIGNDITKIEGQVDDVFTADVVASALSSEVNRDDVSVVDWKSQNEQLLSALQSQGTSSLVIQVFVLLSVIIAVTSILTVTVIQKARQIGILKAMGQTNRSSSTIFIWQGFFMGLGGILVGVPLGLGLFFAFNTFATNPDGTPIVEAYIRWTFIAATGFIVLLAATFAGLIPARQSSKLNPIEIIRNG